MVCLTIEDTHYNDGLYDIYHAFETGDIETYYNGLTLIYKHGERAKCTEF